MYIFLYAYMKEHCQSLLLIRHLVYFFILYMEVWVTTGVGLGFLYWVSEGYIDVSIMPLEMLQNGSFGFSHMLLFAGYARNGINQIGIFVCEVIFCNCMWFP